MKHSDSWCGPDIRFFFNVMCTFFYIMSILCYLTPIIITGRCECKWIAFNWLKLLKKSFHAPDSITCPAPFIDSRNTFLRPWKLTYRYDEPLEIVCTDRSNITRLRCGDGGRLACLDGGKKCIPEAPVCQTPNRAYGGKISAVLHVGPAMMMMMMMMAPAVTCESFKCGPIRVTS